MKCLAYIVKSSQIMAGLLCQTIDQKQAIATSEAGDERCSLRLAFPSFLKYNEGYLIAKSWYNT